MAYQDQRAAPSRGQHAILETARIDDFTSNISDIPSLIAANFPAQLTTRDIWGPHKNKEPYQITGRRASTTDRTTWTDLYAAIQALIEEGSEYSGIGLFIIANLVVIDIDHCIHGGKIDKRVLEILNKFRLALVEISQSGTGLHSFCKGKATRCGKNVGKDKWIEIYDRTSPRFIAVTGNLLPGSGRDLVNHQAALDWLHNKYFKLPVPPKINSRFPQRDWVDEALLEKAKAARNGDKLERLWNGDWQEGYPSQSEADLALCSMLAFYCGSAEQLERLFRQSGLARAKWDSRRGNDTYGAQTIRRALTIR